MAQLSLIIHCIFRLTITIAGICKKAFKTKVFVYFGPMYTITAQHKTIALLTGGMRKSRPSAECISGLPSIGGFSPNIGIIHPDSYNSVLLHSCLPVKYSFHLSMIISSFSEIMDSINAISCFLNPWLYTCFMSETLYFASFPSFNT